MSKATSPCRRNPYAGQQPLLGRVELSRAPCGGRKTRKLDKDFIRNWVVVCCDPYKDKVPEIPREVILDGGGVYIQAYETITGQNFVIPYLRCPPLTVSAKSCEVFLMRRPIEITASHFENLSFGIDIFIFCRSFRQVTAFRKHSICFPFRFRTKSDSVEIFFLQGRK